MQSAAVAEVHGGPPVPQLFRPSEFEMAPVASPALAYQTWDMRLINALGRLSRRPWSIRAAEILAQAARHTRLERFVPHVDWEPLEVLTASADEEQRLTPFGRLMFRSNLGHFAETRLRLEQARQEHPEIFERPVVRPMFIVGLARTGTTLLHHLLSQNRRLRALHLWESLFPGPDPRLQGARRDWRRGATEWLVWNLNRTVPKLQSIHALDTEGPEECTWLLAPTFQSPAFILYSPLRRYVDFLKRASDEARARVYETYRQQLQWIQAGGPEGSFLTKSPAHLASLDVMQAAFPDGCFIQTHRDPAKVVGSNCSLGLVSRARYCGAQDLHEGGRESLELMDWQVSRAVEQRSPGRDRVFDVHFDELLRDPLGLVRRLYAHFDCEFDDRDAADVTRWLAENPQHKHGVHQYQLSDFGLTVEEVRERFAGYCEHFGLTGAVR